MISKYKKLATLILVTLVLFTICIAGYGYNINSIKVARNKNIYQLKLEEFNKIYLYTILCKEKAQEDIDNLSLKIESEIRQEFPDLNILKDELDKNDYSSIYPILKKNVKDRFFGNVENGNNDLFVATTDNIIVDFSYNNNSQFSTTDNIKLKTWDDIIDNSYNKGLTSHAINQIINKSKNTIVWETSESKNKNHKKIIEASYDNLLDIYLEEGLDGLRNYITLVPSYITNTGDIFNTEDFQSGIRIKNYKFIIVQEINIYDQIKKNYPELFNNSIIEEEIDSNNKTINIVYIIGFVLVISYLLTIFLLMTVFNIILAEIDNEENN